MIGTHGYVQLSPQDFAALGAQNIAYVRKVVEHDRVLFAVHTADGNRVGLMESAEVAFAAVRQNGLEPLSVH